MDPQKKKDGPVSKREKKQRFREMKYKKFMGTKSEGHGFADARKQKMVYQYRKLLRKEEAKANWRGKLAPSRGEGCSKGELVTDTSEDGTKHQKSKTKLNPLKKAELQFQKNQAEKQQKRKEALKQSKEKEAAIAAYQEKKKKKYNLICKKNFRGQPSVACQMTLLLEKIQKSKNS